MKSYPYKNLQLLNPSFDTKVASLIIDLNILREKQLGGSTPPEVFFQLKRLFHMLESLSSNRIEGNRTTVSELIESKFQDYRPSNEEKIKEIVNVEEALQFIDDSMSDGKTHLMSSEFIKKLHSIVVAGLSATPRGGGDKNPGNYRDTPIIIANASHSPPKALELQYYVDEFLDFINQEDEPKYDLLKIALAHHRFVWIHPFGNGNGRTVRLLTYAQLVLAGFKVDVGGRIINPTAIFCNDRNEYYSKLSQADEGTQEGLLAWCEYVLEGLKQEIEKIDKLSDYSYLSKEILFPAITFSLDRKVITSLEAEILRIAVKKGVFELADIIHLFPDKASSHVSRFIRRMREKKIVIPQKENSRKYLISFQNKYLIRGVIEMLDKKGFLPVEDTAI